MSNNSSKLNGDAPSYIMKRAVILRANMTVPEKLLWEHIKENKLEFKFRRQHPYSYYIFDFYCHQLKIIIEIDGPNHNTDRQNWYDKSKDKYLQDFGFTILRFSNQEVLNNISDVISEIKLAIENIKNQ